MIYPIVKPFLPDLKNYQQLIEGIFERNYLTNQGPLVCALTDKLKAHLGVEHLLLVANGTLALHIAYQVMGVTKAITTPFTFAATCGALSIQNRACRFSDINQHTFNLDPTLLKQADLKWADSIVPVHVFGNPCDVEEIAKLAAENDLKVIYDAAHCFGAELDGESLLRFGDCATLSLHATKLFHTVEGGAIVFKHREDLEKAQKMINFGQNEQQIPVMAGTNAKMSEMHAAMGLCVLEHIESIGAHRQALVAHYVARLSGFVGLQLWAKGSTSNGAYMPILLESEDEVVKLRVCLDKLGIQTRRYFYPCLSDLGLYTPVVDLPNAQHVSKRVLCLPLYFDLSIEGVNEICDQLIQVLSKMRKNDAE